MRAPLNSDAGLTLVEVLVATVVTALMAVTLFRLTADVSNGMTSTVSHAVTQNIVGGYVQQLRADFGSALDVNVYSAAAPVAIDPTDRSQTFGLCSSWMTSQTSSDWTDATVVDASGNTVPNPNFERTLISLNETTINTASASYATPTTFWVGYEVRANPSTTGGYSMWRVTCTDTGGSADLPSATSQRKIMNLGQNFYTLASGQTQLICLNTSGQATSCAVTGVSATTSNVGITAFTFRLPFQKNDTNLVGKPDLVTINQSDVTFSDSLTTNMKRKIDN
jgi:Tfp pilus assembly protein PilV